MARGMVVGEAIVSQANTKAFDENWDRMDHADDGERGRFVWDPQRKCLVRPSELRESRAIDAPIIADRIHEGTAFDFGNGLEDIGSRSKRRAAMKAHGVEDATDASPEWRASIRKQQEREDSKARRNAMEAAARVLYQQGKWR